MYQKKGGEGSGLMGLGMMGILLASMPTAVALSVMMAVLRRGATVHVVAHRSV